jgi:phospholipid transport system substrate-binding protein
VVTERFGFEEMAKQCLGRYWNDRSPGERQEFIRLFTDLLERTYINDIEGYTSGQTITYGQERVDGDHIDVPSTVITETRDRVPIIYRLVRSGQGWQVYDLVVDGVSLVANYRTQFSRIIQQESYGTLVKKLRTKVKSEEATEGAPHRGRDVIR